MDARRQLFATLAVALGLPPAVWGGTDLHGDPLPADGVEDLQFDSIESMQSALATPAGQAMLADVSNFLATSRSGPVVVGEDYELV